MQINKWPNPKSAPNQEQFLVDYYISFGKAQMCSEIVKLITTAGARSAQINKQINTIKNPYNIGTPGEKKTKKPKES